MQTQGPTVKKSKSEEPRPKDSKPANGKTSALLRTIEPGKISRQDKKKEYLKKKRDRKNFTLAIKENAIEDEKKRNNQSDEKCYNCQKKSHFTRNCSESLKNEYRSWQPLCR